jgi:hypothetical protein
MQIGIRGGFILNNFILTYFDPINSGYFQCPKKGLLWQKNCTKLHDFQSKESSNSHLCGLKAI